MSEHVKTTTITRRKAYVPQSRVEAFIVPLLHKHIDAMLQKHGHPSNENSTVLDVGCGEQPLRDELEAVGYRYFGLDIEQNKMGTTNFIAPIDGTLPSAVLDASASYELVICTEVLEHVANWGKAFENLSSVTAPGSKVLITCPYFYMLHEEPHDYWRPTLHALRYYSNLWGFDIIDEFAAGTAWDVLGTFLVTIAPTRKSRKLIDQIPYYAVRVVHAVVQRVLLNGWIQDRVMLKSSHYHSNVVVLQRRASA